MNAKVETEFLVILRKTCRTMRHSRTRPDLAIPAAEWEIKINGRLTELDRLIGAESAAEHKEAA